ncbi:MAG: hypothetical protein ACT4SY_07155 [Hyphomicrobiales bacterium]
MMIMRLLALLTALCLATAAHAQNNFSTPASACIPTDVAINAARYRTNLASVQHATGAVGNIILMCPMARFNSGTGSWNLKLTYQDSTGTGTTAFVLAEIYRMAIGTAAPIFLKQVNSNSSAITGLNTVASTLLTHTFNFETNIYWVRVAIVRSLASEIVSFHAVYLDGTSI